MRFLVPLLVAALFPDMAQACAISAAQTSLLHERVPQPMPPGAVAAEVVIVTDVRSHARLPLEARIVRMLQGHYQGTRVRIDLSERTSCDAVPYPGMRGIVAGRVLSTAHGILVIDPIRAPSALQRAAQRGGAR